ncbi:RNA polymerase-associated protein LEO1 [Kwoniella heveanensis CBS 569]|nr:RNA polymerase-associated protein LEO1 [Kwoniella heveanensis CBS 569]
MSDSEREDDLFGGSEAGSDAGSGALTANVQQERQASPVASSSKAASPAPAAAEEDGDGDDVAGDLFGDDDEEDEQRKRRRSTSRTSRSRSRSRSGSANPLEYPEEEDGEVERHEQSWATLPLPQWPHMKATDDKIWHLKLPAYVNIESKPYEPDLYRESLDEEPIDGATDPIGAKSKMIGVRNTIRWRWVTGGDGEPMRQSNARMLRWSDGSVSLQLGNDLFDVAPSHGATLARPSDPKPSVPAGKANEVVPNTVSATTFLSVIEPNEQVLVTERAIAGQLSLLPTSMDSKTHLELVKHVGQQHVKHSRMKMLEETADEETLQKLLLKSAPNREMIKGKAATNPRRSNLGGGSGSGLGRTGSGLGGGAGSKGRRSFRKSYYSDSSDDDSGAGSERGGRSSQRTRIAGRDRDRDAAGDYDEDDGFVVADSEEDEDAYGSRRKNKKSNKKRKTKYTDDEDDEDEEELDEMEEAERRIEERERERKRAKKDSGAGTSSSKKKSRDYVDSDDDDEDAPGGGADVDAEGEEEEDMDMDVESEED